MAIHDFIISKDKPNYSASKNSGTLMIQQIAKDTSPSEMQVISYHPGAIYTAGAENDGWKKEDFPGFWDEGK
jgi:NAD(P)-dependent dehydrogenase (short-subunit alcohol dehydrogenase family)